MTSIFRAKVAELVVANNKGERVKCEKLRNTYFLPIGFNVIFLESGVIVVSGGQTNALMKVYPDGSTEVK